MKEYSFMAVFEPGKRGQYSVYFPDLPGCTSWGRNLKHASKMAHEALELHLGGMLEDGDEIPAPSDNPESFRALQKGTKQASLRCGCSERRLCEQFVRLESAV